MMTAFEKRAKKDYQESTLLYATHTHTPKKKKKLPAQNFANLHCLKKKEKKKHDDLG